MTPPKSPVRRRLDELLADRAWHDRDAILADAVGVVAPGVAARRARRDRATERARYARTHSARRPPRGGAGPADDTRIGARRIAREVINSAIDHGAYQRRTHHGTVQIRLTPPGGAAA